MIVTEKDVEDALIWLAEHAEACGKARAEAIYTTDMVDHIEGVLMRDKYADEPVTVRKNIARADDRYLKAIQDRRDAAQRDTVLRKAHENYSMIIEVFRTESANARKGNI